jgi:hypothetical protein
MKTPGNRIHRSNTERTSTLRKPGVFVAGTLFISLALFLWANAGAQSLAAPVTAQQSSSGGVKALFEPMPGFDVDQKEDVALDFYVFGYLEGTPRIEGHRITTSYKLQYGKPMPGALGICRKFIEGVRQTGGEILYDNNRNIVTAKVTQGGQETWAEIACDNDRYRTNIVERQGAGKSQTGTTPGQSTATDAKVRDAVKANADKAFDELNAEEAKHAKVAKPPAGGKSQINDGKTDRKTVSIKEAGAAPQAKGTGSQPATSGTPPGATDLKQQSQGSKKTKPLTMSGPHGQENANEPVSVKAAGNAAAPPAGSQSLVHNPGPDPEPFTFINAAGVPTKAPVGTKFSIVQASGSVVPCADKPTLVRLGYTQGCVATAPDKHLCDRIAGQKLHLVNTSEWSCHSKGGALVKGALVTDRPLP